MPNNDSPAQTPSVSGERKLAAIMFTDVKGYSRLMGEDEEATIRTLDGLSRGDDHAHPAAPRPRGRFARR